MPDLSENTEGEALDLMQLFARTDALIRKFHEWKYDQLGPTGNPHRGQGKILCVLKEQPDISQSRLAEVMGIRQQSLGELLGKLEKAGYVERSRAGDRRTMNLRLTSEGLAAVPPRTDPQEIFGCLTEREQIQFREYLTRVSARMRQVVGAEADDPFGYHPHHRHHRGGESRECRGDETGGEAEGRADGEGERE